MKFEKLEIELKTNYGYNEPQKEILRGRLHFRSENNDWLSFNLNDCWCRKMIEFSLPLFENAMAEKIEILKKEVKENNNG